jgi:hypothetical protein
VERIANPEKVCIIAERPFLNLIKPASKNPKPGVINMTSPVATIIHAVSPVSNAIPVAKSLHSIIKKFVLN